MTPRASRPVQLDVPNRPPTFDVRALDELAQNHGLLFHHWRGVRCPAGAVAASDVHRPHEHPPEGPACQNGYIYVYAGQVAGSFLSAGVDHRLDDPGYLYDATALATFARSYEQGETCGCGKEVRVAPRDKMYLVEERSPVTVDYQELVDPSSSGVDRLTYPAVAVLDLYDAQLQRREDFRVDPDGRIVWTNPPRGPYSIRYTYRPYWYVGRLHHESRVAQAGQAVEDCGVGVRRVRQPVRLNTHASLVREYAFEAALRPARGSVEGGAGDSVAQQFGPR